MEIGCPRRVEDACGIPVSTFPSSTAIQPLWVGGYQNNDSISQAALQIGGLSKYLWNQGSNKWKTAGSHISNWLRSHITVNFEPVPYHPLDLFLHFKTGIKYLPVG